MFVSAEIAVQCWVGASDCETQQLIPLQCCSKHVCMACMRNSCKRVQATCPFCRSAAFAGQCRQLGIDVDAAQDAERQEAASVHLAQALELDLDLDQPQEALRARRALPAPERCGRGHVLNAGPCRVCAQAQEKKDERAQRAQQRGQRGVKRRASSMLVCIFYATV